MELARVIYLMLCNDILCVHCGTKSYDETIEQRFKRGYDYDLQPTCYEV